MDSSSSAKKRVSSASGVSEMSPLTNSNSTSLPSEYYVPSHASINSLSDRGSSSVASSEYESSTVVDSTTLINQSLDTPQKKQTCCDYISFTPKRFKASSKFRKCPRNVPLLLVYFTFCLLGFIEGGSYLVLFYSLNSYNQFTPARMEAIYLGVRCFVHLMYPVAGFISDAYFGQYKVILVSLNIAWIGSAILAAGFTRLDPIFDANGTWSGGAMALTSVGFTLMGWGLAGIKVNLIPFGVDQVPDASSGELSSYFHWYYWCLTAGRLVATIALPYIYVESVLSYVFLLMNAVISIFILVLVVNAPKLQLNSKIGNPLLHVVNVTKCALNKRKRRPQFRSAFHVGKLLPSLLDKAMTEYGGSYSVEQVEDVKTFYRILLILVSFIGYFSIYSQIETTSIFQGSRLKHSFTSACTFKTQQILVPYERLYSDKDFYCAFKVVPSSIGLAAANLLPLLLLIPLCDRVIYVCLNGWKWISMLGRIGIGKMFILMSVTCALAVEVAREASFRNEIVTPKNSIMVNAVRFHTEQADSVHIATDISAFWLCPQYIFFAFAELFCNITAVEFIYAQSPRAMKGLLLGLFFAMAGVSMMLSSTIMLVLGQLPKMSFCSYFGNTNNFCHELFSSEKCYGNRTLSQQSTTLLHEGRCMDSAICAYIIFTIVALLSTFMFMIAACRYKLRKRDPDPVFPFWLYPDTKKENVCLRFLKLLCFCMKDKDWQI